MYFTKRDDCIWFKHLSPDLQIVLSRLEDSESVCLRLDGKDAVWSRMRNGPHAPTFGIRIIRDADIWRAIPRGAQFFLELGAVQGPATLGVEPSIETVPINPEPVAVTIAHCLFGEYLFADYSGAASTHGQRKSIKVASATIHSPASLELRDFTRESLVEWMHQKLLSASERGIRVCLGQDHSYGFPLGFASELGLAGLPWRSAIANFLGGAYATDAPRFESVPAFAFAMNAWLRSRGLPDYFWSATKKGYGLPSRNPRLQADAAFTRVTDQRRSGFGRASPKPFNRVGDNGSVGGQALWGLCMLQQLMGLCERDGIALRCWPFDGLSANSNEYENAHVLIEAYPSALRPPGIAQSDEADALCTVEALRLADIDGRLPALLDISRISARLQETVRFEGWIVGQRI